MNAHIESYRGRPQAIHSGFPHAARSAERCSKCDHTWTQQELEAKDGIRRHMIGVHGFKQVGAQVFKATVCVACSKSGLYKVGSIAYCRDHLHLATEKRKQWMVQLDHGATEQSEEEKARERKEKQKATLHECKRGR